MGVLPLQFLPGQSAATFDLDGTESIDIIGLEALNHATTPERVTVAAHRLTGDVAAFEVRLRIDTPTEADYYRHGGVLNFVLRNLAAN